ncbi:VOC family protein [Roseicella aerolata]|uniref:VOC family protein n=1 Tax=Roseicella aerolata TaxID=2883479 RepID=A0A9X1IFT7_9PROT|nr:VOC family protein [Roseicella aerolata]MCB4822903.1 VOC family protein [Roseicella aerolata]
MARRPSQQAEGAAAAPSHVTSDTSDIARAVASHDRILAPLGPGRQEAGLARGQAGHAGTTPHSWVLRPLDGCPDGIGNGVTIAFKAADRTPMDAAYAAALAAGGTGEGGPGLRPHYHADHYGAYMRDLDGNKPCCVRHRPPA